MNAHREPAYAAPASARIGTSLTRSEAAQDCSIMLPLSVQMNEDDIARIAATLKEALVSVRVAEAV